VKVVEFSIARQMNRFTEIFVNLHGQNTSKQFEAIKKTRQVLAVADPPIQDVIDANLVPKIVEFLDWHGK